MFIVTGGGRGIGEATARRLAADGARIAIVDLDRERAETVAASLPGALAIPSDVSSEKDLEDQFARTLAHFGPIDGAHLNAGIGGAWGVGLADTEMDDLDRVVATNLRGVFLGLREALRYFRGQRQTA